MVDVKVTLAPFGGSRFVAEWSMPYGDSRLDCEMTAAPPKPPNRRLDGNLSVSIKLVKPPWSGTIHRRQLYQRIAAAGANHLDRPNAAPLSYQIHGTRNPFPVIVGHL